MHCLLPKSTFFAVRPLETLQTVQTNSISSSIPLEIRLVNIKPCWSGSLRCIGFHRDQSDVGLTQYCSNSVGMAAALGNGSCRFN